MPDINSQPDAPGMSSFNVMRQAFNGDPFSIFNDDEKAAVRQSLSVYDNPETEAKKQALSFYYSKMNHNEMPFVYQNMDQAINHFHGKPLSVDQAYSEVSNILNPKPQTSIIDSAENAAGAAGSVFKNWYYNLQMSGINRITSWRPILDKTEAVIDHISQPIGNQSQGLDLISPDAPSGNNYGGVTSLAPREFRNVDRQERYDVGELEMQRDMLQERLSPGSTTIGQFKDMIPGAAAGDIKEFLHPSSRDELTAKIADLNKQIDFKKKYWNGQRKEAEAGIATPQDRIQRFWKDAYDAAAASAEESKKGFDVNADKTIFDTFNTQGVAAGAKKLGANLVEGAGSMGIFAADFIAGGAPFATYDMYATASGQKYNELLDAPMSQDDRDSLAIISGLAMAIPQAFIGNIQMFKRIAAGGKPGIAAFKQGIKEAFTQTGAMETTLLADNVADLLYKPLPDGRSPLDLSKGELAEHLTRGMADTALTMPVFGFAGGLMQGHGQPKGNPVEYEQIRQSLRSAFEDRKNQLLSIENPNEGQIHELNKVNNVIASNDFDSAISMLKTEAIDEYLNQREKPVKSEGKSKKAPEENAGIYDGMDETEAAAAAQRNYTARRDMSFHPEDTKAAVELFKQEFPGLDVETRAKAELTASELETMRNRSIDSEGVRAFIDRDGRITVISDNVSPADVPKVVLHEAVGHFGIRKVLGNKLDPFYDSLAKDYSQDIAKFAEAKNKSTDYGFDLSTVDGQRYAANEWLAHVAEGFEKPSYLKELYFKFKNMLRSIPGLQDMRFTDREIEGLLSASYRAARNVKKNPFNSKMTFALRDTNSFYSNVERVIGTLKQETNSKEGWINWLKNQPGVKKEELDWIGLDELPAGKLSKQQVLDYVKANNVQVQEVVKKDNVDENGNMPIVGSIKFGFYQLPGGENYKELLLTIPSQKKETYRVAGAFPINEFDSIEKAQTYIDHFNSTSKQKGMEGLADQIAKLPWSIEKNPPEASFLSSHFSEPNILVHVRFNERNYTEGRRVLFIEEIQSDWHQQGREKGYKDESKHIKELPDNWEVYQQSNGEWDVIEKGNPEKIIASGTDFSGNRPVNTKQNAIEMAIRYYNKKTGGSIPNAPFKTSWPLLAIKRMIRWAAENNFDKIGWTTGEQQAARYDLSKQISKITLEPAMTKDGREYLAAYDLSGKRVINETVEPNKIDDYIGKEAGQKLRDAKSDDKGMKELSGLDLKVGGEGMKGFYDQILPSEVNKYVKKWGGRVGETDIMLDNPEAREGYSLSPEEAQFERDVPQANKIHSLDITPAMRDSVLGGQMMFSLENRKNGEFISDTPEDNAKKYRLFRDTKPLEVPDKVVYADKALDEYKVLKSEPNIYDGRKVKYATSIFGKIERHADKELILKIIPSLNKIYETSVPMFSESERDSGKHPNIISYHNYVNRVSIGNDVYDVRLTVQEVRVGNKAYNPNELHNVFMSDIEMNKTGNKQFHSAVSPTTNYLHYSGLDKILARWHDKVKGAYEKQAAGRNDAGIEFALAEKKKGNGDALRKWRKSQLAQQDPIIQYLVNNNYSIRKPEDKGLVSSWEKLPNSVKPIGKDGGYPIDEIHKYLSDDEMINPEFVNADDLYDMLALPVGGRKTEVKQDNAYWDAEQKSYEDFMSGKTSEVVSADMLSNDSSFSIRGKRYSYKGIEEGTDQIIYQTSKGEELDLSPQQQIHIDKGSLSNPGENYRPSMDTVVSRYSAQDEIDMAHFLMPVVKKMAGDLPGRDKALKLLQEAGFKIHNEGDAWAMVIKARDLLRERGRKIDAQNKEAWIKEKYPILSELRARYGQDFKIRPSAAYKPFDFDNAGEFFGKRKGIPSDEAAKEIGIDEGEMIDYLKSVSNKAVNEGYSKNKHEIRGDRSIDTKARQVAERITLSKAFDIIEGKKPLTDDVIKNEPKVAEIVYQHIMEEPIPVKPDWEKVRNEIGFKAEDVPSQDIPNAKIAESNLQLQALLDASRNEFGNLLKIQSLAREYVNRNIPQGLREEYLSKITKLAEFSDNPSPKYPMGRRYAEFARLLESADNEQAGVRRDAMIGRIDNILKNSNLRRAGKGRVVSLYADAQKELDEVRKIREMNPEAIERAIEYYQEKANEKLQKGEDAAFEEGRASMLETFGMLESRSPEFLADVFKQVEFLARTGRSQLKQFIEARRMELENQRNELINTITGGKGLMMPQAAEIHDAKFLTHVQQAGMKTYLSAMDMESLFSWITSNAPDSFKDTVLYDYVKNAHKAYQASMTGRNNRQKAAEVAFDEIFGTNGAMARGDMLRELKTLQEKTGVFRYQRDPNDSTSGIEFVKVSPSEARILLKSYNETKSGLTDYQAEAVRMKLADIDQRLKNEIPFGRTDDTFTDDVLKVLQDEKSKDDVLIPKIVNPGKSIEQPLTQLQALYLRLCWAQPSVRYKLAFNGWTEESMRQLEKFLAPEAKKYGDWMKADLAGDLSNINAVYKKLYLTEIQGNPDYFPTEYKGLKGKDVGNVYSGEMSVTPGMLSARKFHLAEPPPVDAIEAYLKHVSMMEHFKSHAEASRDMIAVFKNQKVRKAIEQYYGKPVYDALIERIGYFVNAGNANVKIIGYMSKMQSNWAQIKLLWNVVSGFKQMAGTAAYINEIPVKDQLEGYVAFHASPFENAQMLIDTPYFQNRWGGSLDRDIGLMFSRGKHSISKSENMMRWINEKGSLPLRLGDAYASVIGGYAVYRYHLNKLLAEGLSRPEAHKQALLEWEMSTERTQQSGAPHKMNAWQMGGSFERIFTTFKSNPILLANAFISAAHDASKGKPGSYVKVSKTAVTAFIINGLAMEIISQVAKKGLNPDKYDYWRFLYATVMGSFGSLTAYDMSLDAAAKAFMNIRSFGQSTGVPFVDDIGHLASSGWKNTDVFAGDEEDPEKIYKAIEDSLALGGYIPVISPAAKQGTSIMREMRRWYDVFTGSDKKSKVKKHTL